MWCGLVRCEAATRLRKVHTYLPPQHKLMTTGVSSVVQKSFGNTLSGLMAVLPHSQLSLRDISTIKTLGVEALQAHQPHLHHPVL